MGSSSFRQVTPRTELAYSELIGKTVAVDMYNALYKFLSSIVDEYGNPLTRNGMVVSHLYGILGTYANLMAQGIKFIFVFDGKPSEMKYETLKARSKIKNDAHEKYDEAKKSGDIEGMKKYGRMTVKITPEIIESSKKLILLLGSSYIDAQQEGEAQAIELVNEELSDYVSTPDYDALFFNCDHIIRNLGSKYKGHDLIPEMVSTHNTLEVNGVDLFQLRVANLLVGTDYNEGIKKLGVKRSLNFVKGLKKMEDVIDKLINMSYITSNDRQKYLDDFNKLYNMFSDPSVYKNCKDRIIKGTFSKDELLSYLNSLNFNVSRFQGMIDSIYNLH
jgi:flap endonuclease-1